MVDGPPHDFDEVTRSVIGCAVRVHRSLGPGLLESAYRSCLLYELGRSGHVVAAERALPVVYDGLRIECGYRIDLLVDQRVIVEVKAVQALLPLHRAQVITYLKLTGCPVGLLLNFNVPRMVDGIGRLLHPRQIMRANAPAEGARDDGA